MSREEIASDDNPLRQILAKAMGGELPPLPAAELEKALQERRDEYEEAVRRTIPLALERLENEDILLPARVELRGIFRFAHRLDSMEHWLEQENRCTEARERLLAGADFGEVAAAMSQGATKELGGRLGARFLDPLEEVDRQLVRLQPDAISPVFEVDDGFWCYRIGKKIGGEPMPFDDMPWEAKRILLRGTLRVLMGE